RLLRAAHEIVDDRLGVDLLLNVERRRVDDEVGPILLVLAAPDELRIADLNLALLLKLPHLRLSQPDASTVPDDLRIEVRIALPHHTGRQRTRTRIPHRPDRI